RAIAEYKIVGVETTLSFCDFVLQHEAFLSGNFDTKFVEKYFSVDKLNAKNNETEMNVVAALIGKLLSEKNNSSNQKENNLLSHSNKKSNWKNRNR
ncbi:MAG: biotin carboxylase, partial [Bacteroidetes bacterium]